MQEINAIAMNQSRNSRKKSHDPCHCNSTVLVNDSVHDNQLRFSITKKVMDNKMPKVQSGEIPAGRINWISSGCQKRRQFSAMLNMRRCQGKRASSKHHHYFTHTMVACLWTLTLLLLQDVCGIECEVLAHQIIRHEHVPLNSNLQSVFRAPRNIDDLTSSSSSIKSNSNHPSLTDKELSLVGNNRSYNGRTTVSVAAAATAQQLLQSSSVKKVDAVIDSQVSATKFPASIYPLDGTQEEISQRYTRKEVEYKPIQAQQPVNNSYTTQQLAQYLENNHKNDKVMADVVVEPLLSANHRDIVSNNFLGNQLDNYNTIGPKFTFKANGKELLLEPPSSSTSLPLSGLTNGKISAGSSKRKIKKDNRIGESADYDFDFDVGEAESSVNTNTNSNNVTPFTSSKHMFTERQSSVKKGRSTSDVETSAPPPSTSSSLMLPSLKYGDEDDNEDEISTPSNSGRSNLNENKNKSYRSLEESPLYKSNEYSPGSRVVSASNGTSNIINVWPKYSSADRYSTPPSSGSRDKSGLEHGSSRFSTLLTGTLSSENSNQPSDQLVNQPWNTKHTLSSLMKSTSSQSRFSTKISVDNSSPSTGENESGYSRASVKKSALPRAPVYAKSRYTSLSGFKSASNLDDNKQVTKHDKSNEEKGDKNSQLVNEDSKQQSSTGSSDSTLDNNSQRHSSQYQNSSSLNKAYGGLPVTSKPLAASTYEPNSISTEYKTNFTNLLRSLGSMRQQKMVNDNHDEKKFADSKSRIVQRDLSYRMQPFNTPTYHRERSPQQELGTSFSNSFRPIKATTYNAQSTNDSSSSSPSSSSPLLSANTDLTRTGASASDQNRFFERTNSIVRTGPIMPHPFASHPHLRALMPTAVALLAQAQEEQQYRANNQLRALLSSTSQTVASNVPNQQDLMYPKPNTAGTSFGHNLSAQDHMIANSNHLGVSHLGPQVMSHAMAASEANPYNPLPGLADFPNRNPLPNPIIDQNPIAGIDSGMSTNNQATTASNILNDEHRVVPNEFSNDSNSYDVNPNTRSSGSTSSNVDSNRGTNSRSSPSDVYYRQEPKPSRDSSAHDGYPVRSSIDPYEDVTNGIPASEYERDLADLDEEFNRVTYRRPSSQMMSDSYMTLSPERYEGRRYNRRPNYDSYSSDYMSSTSSMSSLPRTYHRGHGPWSSTSTYGDTSDIWTDSSADYNPIASYMTPNHYSYRWRPRYQRTYPANPYMTAATSSEQQLNPYGYMPSYTSALPTETVSFTLSPLAAAAAAAASAIAAADKSRHHGHGWLTIPRIAANTIAPVSTAASSAHAATLPGALQAAAYLPRPPNPYTLGSMPIYAIAPRPTTPISAASSATPSIIPYHHYSTGPALFAYRPAGIMPSAHSLLTAASFAYPMRVPMAALPRYSSMALGTPSRAIGMRPYYSDLQFAETKPKTNLNQTSETKGNSAKAVSLTAMAKNLTRKMFGSASQIRPLHVAPPNPLYDLFAPSNNSTANTMGLASSLSSL